MANWLGNNTRCGVMMAVCAATGTLVHLSAMRSSFGKCIRHKKWKGWQSHIQMNLYHYHFSPMDECNWTITPVTSGVCHCSLQKWFSTLQVHNSGSQKHTGGWLVRNIDPSQCFLSLPSCNHNNFSYTGCENALHTWWQLKAQSHWVSLLTYLTLS